MICSVLLSQWTVEKLNPSSANASDFANAVSGKGLSFVKKALSDLYDAMLPFIKAIHF